MGVDHKHLTGKAARFYRDAGMRAFYAGEARREAQRAANLKKQKPSKRTGSLEKS